ncbi:MAG: hypothetical protein C3F07_05040 [Anaerolineales bacterium]|nr:MAG: hypothetical protein C3F07_05040 [Anaerolineales bacterium]
MITKTMISDEKVNCARRMAMIVAIVMRLVNRDGFCSVDIRINSFLTAKTTEEYAFSKSY